MPDNTQQQQDNLAAALADVSDKLTALVKDEIELAKAEMADKVKSLKNGIIAGVLVAVGVREADVEDLRPAAESEVRSVLRTTWSTAGRRL